MTINMRLFRTAAASALVVALAGCADPELGDSYLDHLPEVPVRPSSSALLFGTVTDGAGVPVSGAQIQVAETDANTMSVPDGAYVLMASSDTSLTLHVTAPGFAPTWLPSIQLTANAMSTGFDAVLEPQAKVDAYNTTARTTAAGYGVVGVQLLSLAGACPIPGAQIAYDPSPLAMVSYAQADGAVAGEPDPTLTAVVRTAGIAAWVAGAFPPSGASAVLTVHKDGCVPPAFPVDLAGRTYTGGFRVEAGSFSQAALFVP